MLKFIIVFGADNDLYLLNINRTVVDRYAPTDTPASMEKDIVAILSGA